MRYRKNWDRLATDYAQHREDIGRSVTNVIEQKGLLPSLSMLYWSLLIFIRLSQALWWCHGRVFLLVMKIIERRGEYENIFGGEDQETT